jgi:glutamate racemase
MTFEAESIGLFDSGVGGFSVVRAIQEALPHENIVYFGDTARMPYGNKSKEAIIRYSLENAYFLQQQKIKLLIVACNTASVHALETLRSTLSIPVISIIDDVFTLVSEATVTRSIGILGTKSTINSSYLEKGFLDTYPDITSKSIACPLFATLVEEGLETHPATLILAQEYLSAIKGTSIDTILLACTHYPFILDILKKVCPKPINFIDPSFACAKKTKMVLENLALINPQITPGTLSIFASNDEQTLKSHADRFLKTSHINLLFT